MKGRLWWLTTKLGYIQYISYKIITDLSSDQFRAADVDGDDEISILDSTLIQKHLSGIIDVFPVELWMEVYIWKNTLDLFV